MGVAHKVVILSETCHVTSTGSGVSEEYSNFAEAKLERISDDVTRKIAPLDFTVGHNSVFTVSSNKRG